MKIKEFPPPTTIPCKDCITLSICKALILNEFSVTHLLEQRCSLFKEYLKFYTTSGPNFNYALEEFCQVFGSV